MFSVEMNKRLAKKYPFLVPKDYMGNTYSDYSYEYLIGFGDIPSGWNDLFLQLCGDLKKVLVKNDMLDSFRFTGVKEKFGTLRCYHNTHIKEVEDLFIKYEHLSGYVCEVCGKPGTFLTTGWLATFCDDCRNEYTDADIPEKIEFDPIIYNGEEELDCSKEYNRLFKNKE